MHTARTPPQQSQLNTVLRCGGVAWPTQLHGIWSQSIQSTHACEPKNLVCPVHAGTQRLVRSWEAVLGSAKEDVADTTTRHTNPPPTHNQRQQQELRLQTTMDTALRALRSMEVSAIQVQTTRLCVCVNIAPHPNDHRHSIQPKHATCLTLIVGCIPDDCMSIHGCVLTMQSHLQQVARVA
jgi:hypothetical protein